VAVEPMVRGGVSLHRRGGLIMGDTFLGPTPEIKVNVTRIGNATESASSAAPSGRGENDAKNLRGS